jgi:HD-like signal output (HDOD) protein
MEDFKMEETIEAKSGRSSGRVTRSEQAIAALLQHGTVEKAAGAINISAATLWRWLHDEAFQEAYRKARRESLWRTVARLQHATGAAATTLLKMMCDPAAPSASRIRAAQSVLDTAYRVMELEELDARIQKLERLSESKGGRIR